MADFANGSVCFPHLAQIHSGILIAVWYSPYEDRVGELDILRAMFKGLSLITKTIYSEKTFSNTGFTFNGELWEQLNFFVPQFPCLPF